MEIARIIKKGWRFLFKRFKDYHKIEENSAPNNPTVVVENPQGFINWLEEGHRTLENQAERWAEILVLDFTKAIITFDLALLGFIGAGVNIGQSHLGIINNANAMYAAVSLSILSIFILSFFLWTTTRININSSADRVKIIKETLVKYHQRDGDANWFEYYQEKMGGAQDDLRKHEYYWLAGQRIGLYLFLGTIIATLSSVIF